LIRTKSAFDRKLSSDGYRILIEFEWPRGLPRGKAADFKHMRELYPSGNLRDWMRRNPRKAESFRDKYVLELSRKERAVEKVCRLHKEYETVTILTVPVEGPWEIYETLVSYLNAACD
jgi:uncharacterized protein YeaO (DUF488 family)